jgi:hypothetical protein
MKSSNRRAYAVPLRRWRGTDDSEEEVDVDVLAAIGALTLVIADSYDRR